MKAAKELSKNADFFESSIDRMKKVLPPYLANYAGAKNGRKSVASALKNVAATEVNAKLKECLFTLSEKQQELADLDEAVYARCSEEVTMMLDDARSGILLPVRDLVTDYEQASKRLEVSSKGKGPDPLHEQRVYQAEDALPIHMEMFEKHRIGVIKGMLESVIMAELKHHCKAVEDLSGVLSKLKQVKE